MSPHKLLQTAARASIAASAALMMPASADAQIVPRSGNISSLYLSSGANYGFRVTLTSNGSDPLSDCVGQFAYINSNFDNYTAYTMMLNTAWTHSRRVTLITNKDTQGFCQVLEILL